MSVFRKRKKINPSYSGGHAVSLLCAIFAVSLLLLPSCIDEKILPDDGPSISENGNLVTIDLPGYIGIQIDQIGHFSTRADNEDSNKPSDSSVNFDDGIESEYALASGNYHYLIIYNGDYTTNTSSTPVAIIPLINLTTDTNQAGKDEKDSEGKITKYDNVTLVANSLISSKDIISSNDYTTAAQVADLFQGNLIVALINFDKSLLDYTTLSDSRITDQSTTAAVLSQITKGDLLNHLCVKDWKIKVDNTNYLTMTNSVCPVDQDTKLDYNYSIDSEAEQRVYTDASQAVEHPIAGVYVERLAVKYTVSFDKSNALGGPNTDSVEEGGDDLQQQVDAGAVITIDDRGFPIYPVSVQKYLNVSFTKDGYSINPDPSGGNATIKIIGVGVSNLEKTEKILKNIETDNYYTNWNNYGSTSVDKNHRCYWTIDPHYKLAISSKDYTNAKGYPHQFRYALETDTIASLFENTGNGYFYTDKNHYYDDVSYTFNGETHTTRYFLELGNINNESLDADCYLQYKAFSTLKKEFDDNLYDETKKEIKPFYSKENTYYEPGMKMGDDNNYKSSDNWIWEWKRVPYTTATNLLVLAQINIDDSGLQTVYRGQNNIFYTTLCEDVTDPTKIDDIAQASSPGLLNSKLYILNNVMLNGGNAGFQIFDGQWDAHKPGTHATILDKVAWNENAFLWLRYLENGVQKFRRMLPQDFTLIPAEISGGDGQALIAPVEELMGKDFRYYIAPYKIDENGNKTNDMDIDLGVQMNFNHLIGLIHKIIGPIDVFTNGYMYYSVPISHSERSFVESHTTKSLESWRTLGKIGVVRNNWYDITIDAITGVGTPVHSVNQPIVPVMEIRRSYINMGVKLMDWHLISQGNVPM